MKQHNLLKHMAEGVGFEVAGTRTCPLPLGGQAPGRLRFAPVTPINTKYF